MIIQIGAGGQFVIERVRLFQFQLEVIQGEFFKTAQADLDFIERRLLRLGGRFGQGTIDNRSRVLCVDQSFFCWSFGKESWDVRGANRLIAK